MYTELGLCLVYAPCLPFGFAPQPAQGLSVAPADTSVGSVFHTRASAPQCSYPSASQNLSCISPDGTIILTLEDVLL